MPTYQLVWDGEFGRLVRDGRPVADYETVVHSFSAPVNPEAADEFARWRAAGHPEQWPIDRPFPEAQNGGRAFPHMFSERECAQCGDPLPGIAYVAVIPNGQTVRTHFCCSADCAAACGVKLAFR